MQEEIDIALEKAGALKEKPLLDELGFGKHFTDHMFLMEWNREQGWANARICQYQNFQMDPASTVLHYGQAIFEGLKAYKGKEDQIFLFRPEDNFDRMNRGAVRMSMPCLPVDEVLKALKALVILTGNGFPREMGLHCTCDRH